MIKIFVRIVLLLFCNSLFFLFANAHSTGVFISEVAINPYGSDTGKEYVELYNNSAEVVDISGWELDSDLLPYFIFPENTELLPSEVLTVALRQDGVNSANQIFTGSTFGSSNMRSSRGMVALFSSATHTADFLEDYVQYGALGETHEQSAIQAGKWPYTMYFSYVDTEGYSIQRICVEHTVECFSLEMESPFVTLLEHAEYEESSVAVFINDTLLHESSIVTEDPVPLLLKSLPGSGSGALIQVIHNGTAYEDYEYTFVPPEPGRYEFVYKMSGADNTQLFTYILSDKAEPIHPAVLTVSEVLFSSSKGENDFIELYVVDTINSIAQSLHGYMVKVDNSTYDLSSFEVSPGEYIIIDLGGTTRVDPPSAHLLQDIYSKGLVSTTEQVQILNGSGSLIGGVCWQGETIPGNEVEEHEFFTHLSPVIWDGECISSVGVKSGQSIHLTQKLYSTGTTKSHYQILPHPTPGTTEYIPNNPPNPTIEVQGNAKIEGTVPFSINLTGENSSDDFEIIEYSWDYGDGTYYNVANPPAHTFTTAGTFIVVLKVADSFGVENSTSIEVRVYPQDQSTPSATCNNAGSTQGVYITEIFPNPTGSDVESEWVELFNPGGKDVVLCEVYLDDSEGGSTPFPLMGITFPAGAFTVLHSSQTKLGLGNTKDSVRLLSSDKKTVLTQVSYENPPEGKSYSIFYNEN